MGTGVGEAALLQAALTGAAVGGGTAALTGGDPLKGALLGGITGGIGSGISGALAGAAPGASAGLGASSAMAPGALAGGAAPSATAAGLTPFVQTPGIAGAFGPELAASIGSESLTGAFANPTLSSGITSLGEAGAVPFVKTPGTLGAFGPDALMQTGSTPSAQAGFVDPIDFLRQNKYSMAAAGLAGALGSRKDVNVPGMPEYKGPLSRFRFDPDTYQAADYSKYRAPGYYAAGGIASLDTPSLRSVPGPSIYRNAPQKFASGGISQLGSYSDGGRMLKGPGDGMSDSIPASISGKRPARLADGEFVVPADVVSGLGNGSTDAGAKQLYAMMDRVRRSRTGTTKQGRQIKPQKLIPA